ncbi:MAG: DNA/RNA non-specific endonuclease [Candidatus Ozemobacteraceae bacterium]
MAKMTQRPSNEAPSSPRRPSPPPSGGVPPSSSPDFKHGILIGLIIALVIFGLAGAGYWYFLSRRPLVTHPLPEHPLKPIIATSPTTLASQTSPHLPASMAVFHAPTPIPTPSFPTPIPTPFPTPVPTPITTPTPTPTPAPTPTPEPTHAPVLIPTTFPEPPPVATDTAPEPTTVPPEPTPVPIEPSTTPESVEKATHDAWNLVFAGFPRSTAATSTWKPLHNKAYAVGFSETRREPLWVSYRLDRVVNPEPLPRPSRFDSDSRVRNPVNTKEYAKTGFDRGHLAPNSAIAKRYGVEAQEETFLMTNIIPQRPDLNRKLWEHIERMEDKYANVYGRVFVITGPIFDAKRENIENSNLEIPDECYKIIVDEEAGGYRILAYRIPQSVEGKESPDEFLTCVDVLEAATGLDFFTAIPSSTQELLESQVATASWAVH